MKFKEELNILDDQLYLWLGDYLNVISKHQSEVISPKSYLKKLWIILKEFIKDFLRIFKSNGKLSPRSNIAFIETQNNFEALKFLSDKEYRNQCARS